MSQSQVIIVKQPAGAEENDIISCEEMLRAEKNKRNELGKYVESISHRVSTDAKKYAWFNAHIIFSQTVI